MKTIWKFPFTFDAIVKVDFPLGAEIIYADRQNGVYCFWAIVDPELKRELRTFCIFGTGHELGNELDKRHHIATIQHNEFVWHVFEVTDV